MEERPPKKRCTKKTDIQSQIQGGDAHASLRTKTVCLDLQRTLRDCPSQKYIRKKLNEISRYCGSYRRLTSLFSNYVYIRKIDQGLELPKLQKKFYDQCWAALDFKAGGLSAINHLSDLANEFVDTCGFDVDTFPPSVKIHIRESVTREMETVAKTYISTNMESKIKGYIRRRMCTIPSFNDTEPRYQPILVYRVLRACLSKDEPILNEVQQYAEIVEEVRVCMRKVWDGCEDKNLKYLLKSKPESFMILLKKISHAAPNNSKSTLLPVWKMSSAMVYFSKTVLKAAFSEKLKFQTIAEFRKCLDIDRVSCKGYLLNGFRTDGYQIQLSLVASKKVKPVPTNTEKLEKAGYQIPAKPFDVLMEPNGLFVVHQTRKDAKKIPPSMTNMYRITSVDPGCSEVVSVRTCDLDKCNSPQSIVDNSLVWTMSGQEYSKKSGRSFLEHRESLRRTNAKYRNSLLRFHTVVKKTSDRALFSTYCRAVASTLKVLYAENTKSARKRSRLHSSRMVQKTVDSLAVKISSSGAKKDEFVKNIVLFGDGSFQAQRGHASAPRKKIVRALAHRGCVGIMDEFFTSKKCPGGCGNDMVDLDLDDQKTC